MTSDIADSLRNRAWSESIAPYVLERAADEIDRLVKENGQLRLLLRERHRLDPVAIADMLAAIDAAGSTTEDVA
jgi:hypothetical protein